MRIHAQSASTSVRRALESIILASGHEPTGHADADLTILDTVHPTPMPPPGGRILTLVPARPDLAADDTSLICPVRPERIAQRLMMLATAPCLTLAQGWSLDILGRKLQHEAGACSSLTEKECALLKALVDASCQPLSRDILLTQVWGIGNHIDTHTLETHIYRLRGKLASLTPSAGDIVTHEGAYRLAFTDHPG